MIANNKLMKIKALLKEINRKQYDDESEEHFAIINCKATITKPDGHSHSMDELKVTGKTNGDLIFVSTLSDGLSGSVPNLGFICFSAKLNEKIEDGDVVCIYDCIDELQLNGIIDNKEHEAAAKASVLYGVNFSYYKMS